MSSPRSLSFAERDADAGAARGIAPRNRIRGIAWILWIAAACAAAAGLRNLRIENSLDGWAPHARAVGTYQSYVVVGWKTAECDPAVVAGRIRAMPETALCIDPILVRTMGRMAGVSAADFVLSADGRHAGVYCFPHSGVPDEKFVARIRTTLQTDPQTAHLRPALAGPAVYHVAMDRVSQHTLPQLMIAIPVAGLLLLWWVTGRLTQALASVAAISLSQVILIGLAGWLHIAIDLSVSMVPPMMMCLGYSYAAHRSLRRRNSGALALCAATTAAAVGSFFFTPAAPVRQFALLGVLGLLLVWLAALTLLPPPLPRRRLWLVCPFLMLRRIGSLGRWPIGATAAAVLMAATLSAQRLRFESDVLNFFPPDTPELADFRALDRDLTGMLPFQVTVAAFGPAADSQMADAATMLRATPGIRKVIDMSFAVHAAGPKDGRVCTFWCMASNDALPALVAEQPRWQEWANANRAEITWRGVAAQLAGAQGIIGHAAVWALPAMAAIAAVAAGFAASGSLAKRLLAAALGATVSILPTAALVLMAAHANIPLGLAAVMIGAITIGVAVDDTLHLLSSIRRHERHHPRRAAVYAAVDCWRPCVGSSLVAAATFSLFATSPFNPTRQFGLLMGAAVLLGLFCNHVMVPLFMDPCRGRFACEGSTRR